jgi:hypothetical protein
MTSLLVTFTNWNEPPPRPGNIHSRRPRPTFARLRMVYYGGDCIKIDPGTGTDKPHFGWPPTLVNTVVVGV